MKRYEVMFLFDSSVVPDWHGIELEVKRLMERVGGNVLVAVKFDDRKLAYEIKGRKRGTYVLAYLEMPNERIGDLERDAQLSDLILRVLVLDGSLVTDARIAELKAHQADQPLCPLAPDAGRRGPDDGYGRRGYDDGYGRGRRDRRRGPDEGFAPAADDVPPEVDVLAGDRAAGNADGR